MGRLLPFVRPVISLVAMSLMASSAVAEVCDKVLWEENFPWLMNAPLWRSLLYELLSPYALIGFGITVLTIASPDFGRWFALLASIAVAALAAISIHENLFPHELVVMARAEGCGDAYLATAILSSTLALILFASFIMSFRGNPTKHP